jgi:hypothetical protein
MTRDTTDTTPAGNIFLDFLKRDPITDSSAADIPEMWRIQVYETPQAKMRMANGPVDYSKDGKKVLFFDT